ncbi:MAG: phosphatidate cytidylyltransferase [Rickettsiales bacterium]|nr:phosphatidate cytidylyltransferase [Rickettsiales bacterium]
MPNFAKRIISTIILAPVLIYLMIIGGALLDLVIISAFLIALFEWVKITNSSKKKFLWWIFGVLYISFACLVLLFLARYRVNIPYFDNFPILMFVIVLLVWINDIFGYIFGKLIGGPKLCPKISPNKTWAGAIGGVFGCLLFFFILNYSVDFGADKVSDKNFYSALLIHIFIPIISQIGDLFESWLKRKHNVKDSGNIIPGHGGILDRIDGLLLVLNVTGIYFYYHIIKVIS